MPMLSSSWTGTAVTSRRKWALHRACRPGESRPCHWLPHPGPERKGALPPQAFIANIFFSWALRLLYGIRVTDIGPFRAVRSDQLFSLSMRERTYGWTLEMMVKAVRLNLLVVEVPVACRRRIRRFKVSGSLLASFILITSGFVPDHSRLNPVQSARAFNMVDI
jgi:hypothetical protein